MKQDRELESLMRSIAEKSLQMLRNYTNQPAEISRLLKKYIDLSNDFQEVIRSLFKNPEKVWQMQTDYWQDVIHLGQEQFNYWLQGKSMPIEDKRFKAEDWLHNPFLNVLSQQYLLAGKHIHLLLENMDYDDQHLARRVRFFSRQYLDALSPANFVLTNPQLMAETIESRGKNLLRGLQNLLTDLEPGSSSMMIKMTDMNAFKPGKNIAISPGQVIFRNDMMELIQFTASTAKVHSIPLLLVPPWINKYYILDLSKQNSLIGWLVGQGITVFVISWVNPDASYSHKGLFNYLDEGPKTAIDVIKKQLDVEQVNTLGFCIGGTLLACLLAYNKAKNDESIHSATFLASLLDFSEPGDMAVFIDDEQISRIEEKMKAQGFLDGRYMTNMFNSLRANDLIWSFFIKNYLQGKDPVPFDILYWNADATNMPRDMHSQYLRWMYLQNDLIKPEKIHLNDTPLDIRRIDIPVFFVSTIKDHIAPWKTTYLGFQLLKGKKRFLLAGSGHIAGIINPPCNKKYGYYRNTSTTQSSDEWLQNAVLKQGSWWPEWATWLKKQSGSLIDATEFAKLPFKGLTKAPGRYVFKKLEDNHK